MHHVVNLRKLCDCGKNVVSQSMKLWMKALHILIKCIHLFFGLILFVHSEMPIEDLVCQNTFCQLLVVRTSYISKQA